jgi:hypothetical protein
VTCLHPSSIGTALQLLCAQSPNDNAAGRQQNRRVEIVIQNIEPILRAERA